jgi:hypothetical protein
VAYALVNLAPPPLFAPQLTGFFFLFPDVFFIRCIKKVYIHHVSQE